MLQKESEAIILREMRSFLFYSQWIWPLHRWLCRSILTPRCKSCVLSSKISSLNEQGLCAHCRNPQKHPVEATGEDDPSAAQEIQHRLKGQLSDLLAGAQQSGQRRFDAVVLFSGGKDSVYLVHTLRKNYPKLRLVLLTVDNSFMSPFAKKNIEFLMSHLSEELVILRPSSVFIEKMFRHAFLNLNSKGCSGTVDQFDGDLLHDIGKNFAKEHKIPLVISGCSKTQVEQILGLNHFEDSLENQRRPREVVAGISLQTIFDQEEMKLWWQGAQGSETFLPRMIFPFFVDPLGESLVLKKVMELGLLPPHSSSPLLTNNQLIPLMAIVDMVRFGYSSFEFEFASMARQGLADKFFWRNIFELSEYSAKTGRFISHSVDSCLERLKLHRRDLNLPPQ